MSADQPTPNYPTERYEQPARLRRNCQGSIMKLKKTEKLPLPFLILHYRKSTQRAQGCPRGSAVPVRQPFLAPLSKGFNPSHLNQVSKRPGRLDEILNLLEKATKRTQKILDDNKNAASAQIEAYEKVLRSKESSEAQRVKATLGRKIEYDRLEGLSSQLSLLYILQMFAFKVKIIQISVDNVKEQLAKSGFLDKTKDIDDIKKNIDTLTILLEAQYEAMKQLGENRENLAYVT
jgi:hypothetical protein